MSTDEELFALEIFISRLLRRGVILAGILLFIGWMTQIQLTGNPLSEFQVYQTTPLLDHLKLIWEHRRVGLIIAYLGVVVLISLPLLRVLLTAILFWRQNERILAGIATFVLVMLLLSFSLGIEI